MIFNSLASVTNTSFPEPLLWSSTTIFQTIPVFSTKDHALDLIFSSSPLLRQRHVTKQRQMKVYSQNVDLTNVAIAVHNRKRDLGLMLKRHVKLSSEFLSSPNSDYEFHFNPLQQTYHECEIYCSDHLSQVFDDMSRLYDILYLYTNFSGHIWINSTQTETLVDSYGASYTLSVLDNKKSVNIFPFSEFNNQTTTCHYLKDFTLQSCVDRTNLGAETKYFEFRAGNELFYNRHLFDFKVQLSIPIMPETRNENVTLLQWYRDNVNFQIFIPRASHLKSYSTEKAQCICLRPQNVSYIENERANVKLSETFLAYDALSLGIERPRVRGESHNFLSTVPYILSDLQNEKYRSDVDQYLNEGVVFPLFINSTDWVQGKKANDSELGLHTSPSHQNLGPKTASLAAAAAAGLLKIASIGLPFVLDQAKPIWAKLSREHSGFFIKPDLSSDSHIDPGHFQEYLDRAFKENSIRFRILTDRIKVYSDEKYFKPQQPINKIELAQFEHEVASLDRFQQRLYSEIPNLLISRLLAEVKHKIDEDSDIFVEILPARSFVSYRIYYLELLEFTSVTTYNFYVLPHAQRQNSWEYFFVQNMSLHFNDNFLLSSQHSKEFLCQKAVMGTQITTQKDMCSIVTRNPPLVEIAIEFLSGYTLFVRGSGVIHFSCVGHPASMLVVRDQCTLYMVHASCSLHAVFENSLQFDFPAKSKTPGDFQVFPLLRYKIPIFATRRETVNLFMISVLTVLIIFILLLSFLGVTCWYYKRKLGIRIARHIDTPAPLEIQFVNQLEPTQRRLSLTSSHQIERNAQNVNQQTLPSMGGPVAEAILETAFKSNILRNQNQTFSEVNFYNQTFPHMNDSSGSSTITFDSGLVASPRRRPSHLCLTPQCTRDCKVVAPCPFVSEV